MINLILTLGRQRLLSHFVKRFTIVHSYGTKVHKNENIKHSLRRGSFFLSNYVKPPNQHSQVIPNEGKQLAVSDVKNLMSSQSCVEAYKRVLSQNKLIPMQRKVLDAIQMKIWELHIIDLDFEQLFELIERSILKNYYCEHLTCALFIRATEKFDVYDWDATSITRLMITSIVYRDVPRALMHKVHTFACLNLKLFSMEQLTVIVNAFYLGKFNYDDADFFTSAVLHKTVENLGSMHRGQLPLLLKACKFRRVDNFKALHIIANELMKNEKVLKRYCQNLTDVSQLMKQYAQSRLDIPEFVTTVLRVMPKPDIVDMKLKSDYGIIQKEGNSHAGVIRLKDIGTLSWALGSMAYDLDNKTGIHSYLEKLFTAICNPMTGIDQTFVKDFFFGQVVAGRFTPTFFNYMRHSNQLFGKPMKDFTSKPRGMLTILLRVSMDIDCPEVELQKLPRGFMEMKMKKNVSVAVPVHFTKIANKINEMLGEKLVVCQHTILPYILLVAEIRLDENNRPVPFKPTKYEDLLEEMKNKELMMKRGRRIVILIANQGTYQVRMEGRIRKTQPTGMTLLTRRHLQKLGYEVIFTVDVADLPKDLLTKLVQDFGVQLNKKVLERYRIEPKG